MAHRRRTVRGGGPWKGIGVEVGKGTEVVTMAYKRYNTIANAGTRI